MRSSGDMDFVIFCMSDEDKIKSDIVVECRSNDRRVRIKHAGRLLFLCFVVAFLVAFFGAAHISPFLGPNHFLFHDQPLPTLAFNPLSELSASE